MLQNQTVWKKSLRELKVDPWASFILFLLLLLYLYTCLVYVYMFLSSLCSSACSLSVCLANTRSVIGTALFEVHSNVSIRFIMAFITIKPVNKMLQRYEHKTSKSDSLSQRFSAWFRSHSFACSTEISNSVWMDARRVAYCSCLHSSIPLYI